MAQPELLLDTRRFQVIQKYQDTPQGSLARQIVLHRGAVVILPIFDDGRVVLIRNFRISVDEELIELPAGTLEDGEDPLATAHRELAEETGYRARSIELLTDFFSSPGILTERMFLYLATGLEGGEPALEQGEDIQAMPVAWDEALRMARDGRIHDAKTLVGLLYYGAFRRA
jgi:ADP-ribose pyrophosphatase